MTHRKKKVVKEEVLEESDVVVQFSGLHVDQTDLRNKLAACKFYNLEEENPVVRVGNQFFRGTFEPIHGTAVCFEVSQDTSPEKDASDSKKKLTFVTKTDKTLITKRIFLRPKTTEENGSDSEDMQRNQVIRTDEKNSGIESTSHS